MKYIHKFDSESAFTAFKSSSEYLEPNVALTEDDNIVHYNRITNGHEYVDLGLPSGTKWATTNVGAKSPEEYGLFFQWGDTSGYTADQIGKNKQFNWNDYKWNPSGDGETFTKYNTVGATLELEDDAAHVNMGGTWHMPTPEQIQELINETDNTWTTQYGVNGWLFTSKKDDSKSIFIPAAGYARRGSLNDSGSEADVWSSVLHTGNVNFGQYLNFNSGDAYLNYDNRYGGFSVRGVLG